ncbi:MAG: hypothetical protein Q8O67_06525 [Deltaproteobacteria bacterium]|nr:hypothetical protein [Deltaproteobacteria bacterium]
MKRALLALAVVVASLHAAPADACGGYMESVKMDPIALQRTRADVIAMTRDAEAALERGQDRAAIDLASQALVARLEVGGVDIGLDDRATLVAVTASVFSRGQLFIDDTGNVSIASGELDAARVLSDARKALKGLLRRDPDNALAQETLAVANVLIADHDVAVVRLLELQSRGALTLPQSLAVLAAATRDLDPASSTAALALCRARAIDPARCDVGLPAPVVKIGMRD